MTPQAQSYTFARIGRVLLIIFFVPLVYALILARATQAQTYAVLHDFTGGGEGSVPQAGLTVDRAGNFYGTASNGGNYGSDCQTQGCGVVFKLARRGSGWILTPIYSFQGGTDGAQPFARVIIGPNGSLYGTTGRGGTGNDGYGYGTIFNLQPPSHACANTLCPWVETVLYRFMGGNDGWIPGLGDLTFDAAGNIYGTTGAGGSSSCNGNGCGVVFKLAPSNGAWTETVLYRFAGGTDGALPEAGVILDGQGNIYGTTAGGGVGCVPYGGCGVVFKLTRSGSDWVETVLYTFTGGDDGQFPSGGLIFDSLGNLYGTTSIGGSGGGGTVFELSPSNGSWTFNTLYSFQGEGGSYASLTMDPASNLYGTTWDDGSYGSVFRLSRSNGGWIHTTLAYFGGSLGQYPYGSVALDSSGNLYGTTTYGGIYGGSLGYGVVWKITP
jgi:uncharacterized repeat protein (TIGR03803 family)